jgi:diguanylate cyclase (GGDEF)-like protein/PAS domain S-box-containing protein
MTFTSLKDGLERLELPSGGSVFMVDRNGTPFIGTDNAIVRSEELPQSTEELYVASSRPLSSGWRVSVVVPRASLAESFAELRRPFAMTSATLLMLVTVGLSVLVGRMASRTHKLAAYFREATEESQPLRELFRSRDEFSYLNQRFNEVFHEAQSAQEEKLARERVFRFLLEQAPIGFFRSRTDGTLDYINPHCAVMLGYAREEAYAALSSVKELYDNEAERERLLHELTTHGEVRNRKIRFVKKSGERFWVSMTARAHADPETSGSSRIEGFLIDITEDVEEQQTLRSLAETDPLTGVGNRRALEAEAEGLVRHARANDQPLAALVFDIDDFKSINDTHGHDAGDAVLKQVTGIVRTVIRTHDVFARLGGDEFCIIMPEAGEAAALRLAERLVDALHSVPPPAGIQADTRLSIGVAALQGADIHLPELLKAADTALYRAKRSGREAIRRASEDSEPPPS